MNLLSVFNADCKELLALLRKQPNEWEALCQKEQEDFVKKLQRQDPLDFLAFAAKKWSFEDPSQAFFLPFLWQELKACVTNSLPSNSQASECEELLQDFKELFFKKSVQGLYQREEKVSSKEIEGAFKQLLANVSEPKAALFHTALSSHQQEIYHHLQEQVNQVMNKLSEAPGELKDFEIQAGIAEPFLYPLCHQLHNSPPTYFFQPFFYHQKRFYCLAPSLFNFSSMGLMLSCFAQKGKEKQAAKNYQKALLYDGLSELFPSAHIYQDVQLKDTHPQSDLKDLFVDYLVRHDQILIGICLAPLALHPSKEDKLSPDLGALMQVLIKKNMAKQQQLLNFLKQVKHFTLCSSQGEVLKAVEASRLERGYLLSLTLEPLGTLLPKASFFPHIMGYERKDPFWPLSLQDFMLILGSFSNATDFLLFIERRLAANFRLDPEQELSEPALLVNYKENQLMQLKQEAFADYHQKGVEALWHEEEHGDEENQQWDSEFNRLISSVEHSGRKGCLEVTSFLLKLPLFYQRRLMKMFQRERESFLADGKGHGFSRFFKEEGIGVTLFCASQSTLDSFWGKMYQYVNKKVSQSDCQSWVLITEVHKEQKIQGYDFRIYR